MKLPYGATKENLDNCILIVQKMTGKQEVTETALNILNIIYAKGGNYSIKTIEAFVKSYLGGKSMNKGLDYYKGFIDGLVKRKDGVDSRRILGKGYPQTEENKALNELLSSLTPEQKSVLARTVQKARDGGIHDTLAYMDEMMDCDGLVMSQNGEVLPYDTFESMHYDFICRCEGDEWPK